MFDDYYEISYNIFKFQRKKYLLCRKGCASMEKNSGPLFEKHVVPENEKMAADSECVLEEYNNGEDIDVVYTSEIEPEPGTGAAPEIKYKTAEVAERLNISSQSLRNFTEYFDDVLNIERTESGHRLYSEENIKKIEGIMKIKKERHFTMEQTLFFLLSEDDPDVAILPEKRFEFLLKSLSQHIETTVSETLQSNMATIAEKSTSLLAAYEKKLDEKDEIIKRLIEENRSYEEKLNEIKLETTNQLQKLEQTELENKKEIIESFRELSNSKKKKWFGLW